MRWLTFLFAIFILVIIVLADRGTLPGLIGRAYRIPFGDKAGHFVLYGIMAFLLDLTFLQALPGRDPKWVVLTIGLIFALMIGAEEFSQKYFPLRTFSLVDLTASYLGVIFFSWLGLRIKNRGDGVLRN